MAPLPDPVIDDEVRTELKSAMEQTGAPAELIEAISTVDVDDQLKSTGDHGQRDQPSTAGRRKRRRRTR